MTRHPLATTAALALALVLTGCSSDEGDDPTVTQPSVAAPGSGSTKASTFASTTAMIDALDDAGLPCEEPQTGTFPGVAEAQSCILNESEDVVLLRFADEAEQADYLANKDELASAVVGDGWAVQTVLPDTAEQVAAALGGEVVPGAS